MEHIRNWLPERFLMHMKKMFPLRPSSGLRRSDLIDWMLSPSGQGSAGVISAGWSRQCQRSLTCRADQSVVKSSNIICQRLAFIILSNISSSVYRQGASSFFLLVSTLSWSEELCLFLSIFSLYLQCSSYRGKRSLSLCFSSSVASLCASPSVLASDYYTAPPP